MKLSIDFLNRMEHLFSMPITISNVSGEIKSEIGSLVRFYKIRRITPVQSMYGKGVFGKTLFNLTNQTHEIAPENLSESLGIQKKDGSLDVPVTYEQWLESKRVNDSFFERRVDNRD